MQVLIDTDVTLDFLLMRQPFAHEAREVFKACAQDRLTGFCAAITPITVFATAQAVIGTANARALVGDLLTIVGVCPLDAATLRAAHALPLTDFADAVQVASAQALGLDAIITRNGGDNAGVAIPVLTPAELLSRLAPPPDAP